MDNLPSEILFEIAACLTSQCDIHALSLLNRRFNGLFTRPLYLFNHAHRGCDGLSWAANYDRPATARIFLDFGIPVDTKFSPSVREHAPGPLKEQRPPIHWVAAPSSPSSLSTGFTALHLATLYNHESLVDLLLQRGANPAMPLPAQTTALAIALDHRHERIACLLAAHLPNLPTHILDPYRKLTPLHRAAWLRLPLCTRFFVGKGVDVNALDSRGNTPLHHALAVEYDQLGQSGGRRCEGATDQNRETVLELVRAGADLDKEGYYGYTPRLMAFAWEDEAVVRCLLGEEKGDGMSGEVWMWAERAREKVLATVGAGARREGEQMAAKPGDWEKCLELMRGEARQWRFNRGIRGPFLTLKASPWGTMLTVQEWVESVMARVAEGAEAESNAARPHDRRLVAGLKPSEEGRQRGFVEGITSRWVGISRAWT